MRRDFILVGLLVGLFVFPYVLTIEESDAAGEVVADPNSCPGSSNSATRILCLSNKVKQLSEQAKDFLNHLQETEADLTKCQAELQTVEPHVDACSDSQGSGPNNPAGPDHQLGPDVITGISSPKRNNQPLDKIEIYIQLYYRQEE